MRDVKRCIHLCGWFNANKVSTLEDNQKMQESQKITCAPELHPIVLSLAICYHTRLATTELRHTYRHIQA
jgi:hypothetical protein